MDSLNHLKNKFEFAEYLQNSLVAYSTGDGWENGDAEYKHLRNLFMQDTTLSPYLPDFVRKNRDLSQFWGFIKYEFQSYAERRKYIWESFSNVLELLEKDSILPIDSIAKDELIINSENISREWEKALQRKIEDPEGAITISRTLLESTIKHIMDDRNITYGKNDDFSVLYGALAKEMKLSPDAHSEKILKQILGGCSSAINGLALLRNVLGDGHGSGKKKIKPSERHAELAVNLAGSMSLFLFKTHHQK